MERRAKKRFYKTDICATLNNFINISKTHLILTLESCLYSGCVQNGWEENLCFTLANHFSQRFSVTHICHMWLIVAKNDQALCPLFHWNIKGMCLSKEWPVLNNVLITGCGGIIIPICLKLQEG